MGSDGSIIGTGNHKANARDDSDSDEEYPASIIGAIQYSGPPIVTITSSDEFSVILDCDGGIWLNGDILNKKYLNRFVELKIDPRFVDCSCGEYFAIAIDDKQQLWAVGASPMGDYNEFTLINHHMKQPIVKLSCGNRHVLLLDETGNLWGFGACANGQVGIGKTVPTVESPTLISTLSDITIIDFAASYFHSCALDEDGTIWTWGKGSLCLNETSSYPLPAKFANLISMSIGNLHGLAQDADGNLWGFGDNDKSQLSSIKEKSLTPRILPDYPPNPIQYSCGYCFSMVMDCEGNMWVCGFNRANVLGLVSYPDTIDPVINHDFSSFTISTPTPPKVKSAHSIN